MTEHEGHGNAVTCSDPSKRASANCGKKSLKSVSERSKKIFKPLTSNSSRASNIRAELNVLIPSQIRALRLKRENMTQKQLAALAEMAQPRISAMERPGETKFNIETLVRLARCFQSRIKSRIRAVQRNAGLGEQFFAR